ncbi:MAG: hypothetical protein IJX71_01765 [Oscillospiraceae bacterium]|nr:hypothetical protein [Oscillospiraceae bacterium]
MRKVDITEKLSFAQPPVLVVKERELPVHNDAATILKVMEVMGGGLSYQAAAQCFKLLFDESAMIVLEELKLSLPDFQTLVAEAMKLATGSEEEEAPGEAQTRTMT